VRNADPKPDISTVAAFVAALRAAPRIAYVDPASGGTSGIYFRNWLERQGLGAEMAPKTRVQAGGYVAELVERNEADLVVHQISEILPVKGVTLVGPLPAEIQLITTYSAGLSADAREPAVARAFLAHMTGATADPIVRDAGSQSAHRGVLHCRRGIEPPSVPQCRDPLLQRGEHRRHGDRHGARQSVGGPGGGGRRGLHRQEP
jgi:molybdate transport system substrate-binding protein